MIDEVDKSRLMNVSGVGKCVSNVRLEEKGRVGFSPICNALAGPARGSRPTAYL